MLEIQQVHKTFHSGSKPKVHAIRNVSLSVHAGQFVALRGASGCGKTTLLLMAGGLLAPDKGTITLQGQNPYALSSEARARFRSQKVGFVFQQFHLIPYLDVFDNVLSPALASKLPEARDRAADLIAHFGLKHRRHHVPSELSTGERQRTALARALLNQPKLLLADEPTGNLDPENAEAVLEYLTEFVKNGGAVLLVTHEDKALQYAQTVHLITEGSLTPHG
jgi:ABC-type lipoprotein export system ATPase subunit